MAYTKKEIEEKFSQICKFISEEGLSLRKSLDVEYMPDMVTFYKWLDSDENKIKQYARACEARAELLFEEILDISDATEDDIIIDENGNPITNHNVIQRDRLRTDNRKWMLGKMQPKKYGDKIHTELSGGVTVKDITGMEIK